MQVFFQTIMRLSPRKQARIVREAVRHAQALKHERPEYDWVVRLHQAYPSDIGAIFPAILNLVYLQPGQALFLEQGELHAYLDGVGIELMANSDNVLRGGLTSKHVDVDELMHILSFEEKQVDILAPKTGKRMWVFTGHLPRSSSFRSLPWITRSYGSGQSA